MSQLPSRMRSAGRRASSPLLALVLAGLCACSEARRDLQGHPEGVEPLTRHIAYGFSLQNETHRVIKDAHLWAFAPVRRTATQRCDHLEVSHPFELISDALGNQVLHFVFDDFPPHGSKIITIRATLRLLSAPAPLDDPAPGSFLGPEKVVEPHAAAVVQLARSLAQGSRSPPESFFNWITGHIGDGGYTRNERGALSCLTTRRGDCTEQAALFVALCRAVGVPARWLGGVVIEGDRMISAGDYHNWAEYHQDGIWRLADPHGRVLGSDPWRYIAFRVMGKGSRGDETPLGDAHRFRSSGEGLRVRMTP